MKKRIFSIFLIAMVAILIVGCTTAGATDMSKNLNKDNEAEDSLARELEDIDNSGNEKGDKKEGPDLDENNEEEEGPDEINKDEDRVEADENLTEKTGEKQEEKSANGSGKINYSGDGSKKLVALTFDDGPEAKYTPEILDILDEYNIRATFFIIGQNAAKHPDVLKDIYDRGHEIGSHSWSHKYLPKISKEAKKNEILGVQNFLEDILGEYTPIFRPPYGAVKDQDKQLLASLGYEIVNWSVDTRDWAGTPKEQMMKYVKEQLKPGGIILMHNTGNIETVPNLIETLPHMIDWITEEGYEFVTVTEILN